MLFIAKTMSKLGFQDSFGPALLLALEQVVFTDQIVGAILSFMNLLRRPSILPGSSCLWLLLYLLVNKTQAIARNSNQVTDSRFSALD